MPRLGGGGGSAEKSAAETAQSSFEQGRQLARQQMLERASASQRASAPPSKQWTPMNVAKEAPAEGVSQAEIIAQARAKQKPVSYTVGAAKKPKKGCGSDCKDCDQFCYGNNCKGKGGTMKNKIYLHGVRVSKTNEIQTTSLLGFTWYSESTVKPKKT